MILVGNQRAGGSDLARHLMKDENDHVLVHDMRGFVAHDDLHEAFKEIELTAKGTRCRQYLFSLSLNPPQEAFVTVPQFEAAIKKIEKRLGLEGQPRAIVFHEKEGRRHAHAVWSRIDIDKMKAVQLSHSKRKLNMLSKELYLEHDWKLPPGQIDKSLRDEKNFTFADWQQAKRTHQDPRHIKAQFKDAWENTNTREEFYERLKKSGYLLTRGSRRNYVAVDRFGEIYSVPRMLGIKTKEARERLGDPSKLIDAEYARKRVTDKALKALTGYTEDIDKRLAEARAPFEKAKADLAAKQRQERTEQHERLEARWAHENIVRQSRFRTGIKGLWDFVRGENARIKKQNRQEAHVSMKRDEKEREGLIKAHLEERRALFPEIQKVRDDLKTLHRERRDLIAELRAIQKQREENGDYARERERQRERSRGRSR